ncbi:MAG: hypothetical protein ACJ8G1_11760 [Vitreoscilla sp.]
MMFIIHDFSKAHIDTPAFPSWPALASSAMPVRSEVGIQSRRCDTAGAKARMQRAVDALIAKTMLVEVDDLLRTASL